jgi:transcription initiation factor IIE alpha subunit
MVDELARLEELQRRGYGRSELAVASALLLLGSRTDRELAEALGLSLRSVRRALSRLRSRESEG